MKKNIRIAILLFVLAITLSYASNNLNTVNIGFVSNKGYNAKLEDIFSRYYNLVPFSKEQEKTIIRLMKEEDLGLRKGEMSQLPHVDYIIDYDATTTTVKFLDTTTLLIKRLKLNKDWFDPTYRILYYFKNFVLYFKLPDFEDKQARAGAIYVLMNKNFKDIGYYTLSKKETHIEIEQPGAVYARKLRPSIFENGKVLYERQEGDLTLNIVDNPGITEYKNGDETRLKIFVEKPGFITVVDIYKDEISVISSNFVKYGYYRYTFTAYYGDGSKETLLFILTDNKVQKNSFSYKELKELLEKAEGMDLMNFIVTKNSV
jgi:hypothetical protein